MSQDLKTLLLASSSPRRRALLEQLGIPLQVAPPHVDESDLPGEAPRKFALRVARKKGLAAAAAHPGRVVLAADTTVVLEGRLYNKPRDRDDALRMLQELSDREHAVITGVFAVGPKGLFERAVETKVKFRAIGPAEAAWYVETGEPLDKAGAYGIQERGGMFVASIKGSYSNVVGLPLAEAVELVAKAGLALPWEG